MISMLKNLISRFVCDKESAIDPLKVDWSMYALFKPVTVEDLNHYKSICRLGGISSVTVTVDLETEDPHSGYWYYTVIYTGITGSVTSISISCKDLDISKGFEIVPLVVPQLEFVGSIEHNLKLKRITKNLTSDKDIVVGSAYD